LVQNDVNAFIGDKISSAIFNVAVALNARGAYSFPHDTKDNPRAETDLLNNIQKESPQARRAIKIASQQLIASLRKG